MKHLILAAALLAAPAAEAAQWRQSAAATDPAAMAQARCQLASQGIGGGFYAYGSTGFVVGATIGNLLAEAIAQTAFVHQCMRSLGFEPVSRAQNKSARGTGNSDLHRGSTSK